MAIHRFRHSFTAGELSPLMADRADFDRYATGSKRMYNAFSTVQGPAMRRSGFKFVYDLADVGIDVDETEIRLVPFIRSEGVAYILCFFKHTGGNYRVVFFQYGDIWATAAAPTVPFYIDLGATWNIAEFDWAQNLDEMIIAQRGVAPYVITKTLLSWTGAAIGFTNLPDPAGKTWNAAPDGWPERVTFHQQRLCFAASIQYRDTIWLSASGEYYNFQAHSLSTATETDANSLSFSLASGTFNRIQWMLSSKSLHVGTVGDEWTVTGSDSIAITANSKLSLRQTKMGSEPIKPILVGSTTLFVERFGRSVNEFVYDYSNDNYKVSDLAVLSPHVTENYSIVDWTYQQTPDSVIWCVREDGALYGITYQRSHKVVGWHGHATGGSIRAVASIPGDTREDDLWMVIDRVKANGDTQKYIEVMADKFENSEARFGKFADSFVEYQLAFTHSPAAPPAPAVVLGVYPLIPTPDDLENASALPEEKVYPVIPADYPQPIQITATVDGDATFTGLDHLEGYQVCIMIDGAVFPPGIVVGGEVDVERALIRDPELDAKEQFVRVIIGLPYISEIRPNVVDAKTQDGTTLGRTQRITKLSIDLYRTLGMKIGTVTSETGKVRIEEKVFRLPTDLTGTGSPLFTGIYNLDFPEGFDRKSDYFIRQEQPLPMCVRGVTDTVEVFE